MTHLSVFSDDEKETLVRLPYHVAVFISRADNAQSDEETEDEINAFKRIVKVLPNLYEGIPLIQEIFSETHARQEEWGGWDDKSLVVQEKCSEAMSYLKQKAEPEEASAYARAVHEVADTVARAVAEAGAFEIHHVPDKGLMKIIYNAMQAIGMTSGKAANAISAKEQTAISEVDAALGLSR